MVYFDVDSWNHEQTMRVLNKANRTRLLAVTESEIDPMHNKKMYSSLPSTYKQLPPVPVARKWSVLIYERKLLHHAVAVLCRQHSAWRAACVAEPLVSLGNKRVLEGDIVTCVCLDHVGDVRDGLARLWRDFLKKSA